MTVLAIINQKGGVGKTATAINFSHALALSGQKVLLIDLDPQAHLSAAFNFAQTQQKGLDEVLLNEKTLDPLILSVRNNMDLVPAGSALGQVELIAQSNSEWGFRLKHALSETKQHYDQVILDCPPASGMLVMNALLASDSVLVPVVADYFGMRGLSYLLSTLRKVEKASGVERKLWIALTRFHTRRKLSAEVKEKLKHYFPGRILATAVRENVSIAEAPSFCKSIHEYRKNSHGAQDYQSLAMDYLKKRVLQ